jgi:hypothetical protein
MSDRFESHEDLVSRIEGEGGVLEAVDYGVHADDMPESDTELAELWAEMETAYRKAATLADKVHALLEPHGLA